MNKEVKELLNKCDNCDLEECFGCKFTYADIQKIKNYLEQKESILDKVTEFVTKIATENAEKYNSENQKEVDFSEWNLALELLNIIEGGRNGKQRN